MNKKELLTLLLAHRHFFTISLLSFRVKVCARCSGLTIGFIISLPTLHAIKPPIQSLTQAVIIALILATPAILDWVTQSWRLRESSNEIRLATGLLEGLCIALIAYTPAPIAPKLAAVALITLIVFLAGSIGRVKHYSI